MWGPEFYPCHCRKTKACIGLVLQDTSALFSPAALASCLVCVLVHDHGLVIRGSCLQLPVQRDLVRIRGRVVIASYLWDMSQVLQAGLQSHEQQNDGSSRCHFDNVNCHLLGRCHWDQVAYLNVCSCSLPRHNLFLSSPFNPEAGWLSFLYWSQEHSVDEIL